MSWETERKADEMLPPQEEKARGQLWGVVETQKEGGGGLGAQGAAG